MIRLKPEAFSELYGKNLIAYGTGITAKRYVPYLAQDPDIQLCGITNSRITADDEGTFLDTGLPVRSIRKWAELLPDATILLTGFAAIDEIITECKNVGFHNFQFITPEMVSALADVEADMSQKMQPKIFELLCLSNEIHDAHRAAFSEFKSCNRGKTVSIVGTGPSLNFYTQLPETIHIGVNSSYLKKDLTLDYYFVADNVAEWLDKLKEYSFIKFFNVGMRSRRSRNQISESIIEENAGRRYFNWTMTPFAQIQANIECYPLMSYGSVIFHAIHFALYTHPKRLLLVGCDCAANGHYDGEGQRACVGALDMPLLIKGYQNVKKFASIHYPDTEIISVNPVGLKGMFHDVYTRSYLDAHPEIARDEVEILNPQNYLKGM